MPACFVRCHFMWRSALPLQLRRGGTASTSLARPRGIAAPQGLGVPSGARRTPKGTCDQWLESSRVLPHPAFELVNGHEPQAPRANDAKVALNPRLKVREAHAQPACGLAAGDEKLGHFLLPPEAGDERLQLRCHVSRFDERAAMRVGVAGAQIGRFLA